MELLTDLVIPRFTFGTHMSMTLRRIIGIYPVKTLNKA